MGYNCQVGECIEEGECHERNGQKFTLCNKHWIQFQRLEQTHFEADLPQGKKDKRRDRAKKTKRLEADRRRANCPLQALRPVFLDEIPDEKILWEQVPEAQIQLGAATGKEGREESQESFVQGKKEDAGEVN